MKCVVCRLQTKKMCPRERTRVSMWNISQMYPVFIAVKTKYWETSTDNMPFRMHIITFFSSTKKKCPKRTVQFKLFRTSSKSSKMILCLWHFFSHSMCFTHSHKLLNLKKKRKKSIRSTSCIAGSYESSERQNELFPFEMVGKWVKPHTYEMVSILVEKQYPFYSLKHNPRKNLVFSYKNWR